MSNSIEKFLEMGADKSTKKELAKNATKRRIKLENKKKKKLGMNAEVDTDSSTLEQGQQD